MNGDAVADIRAGVASCPPWLAGDTDLPKRTACGNDLANLADERLRPDRRPTASRQPDLEPQLGDLEGRANGDDRQVPRVRKDEDGEEDRDDQEHEPIVIAGDTGREGDGPFGGPMDQLDEAAQLNLAIEQARIGRDEGGVPIGAVLIVDGKVIGCGRNRRMQAGSAIRHGETDALEDAGRQAASVYRRATMVTTLSPCDMCTGAILLYGIPRVIIGENRTFVGGEELLRSRGVELVVVDSEECVALMREFIAAHPDVWNEDIGE